MTDMRAMVQRPRLRPVFRCALHTMAAIILCGGYAAMMKHYANRADQALMRESPDRLSGPLGPTMCAPGQAMTALDSSGNFTCADVAMPPYVGCPHGQIVALQSVSGVFTCIDPSQLVGTALTGTAIAGAGISGPVSSWTGIRYDGIGYYSTQTGTQAGTVTHAEADPTTLNRASEYLERRIRVSR